MKHLISLLAFSFLIGCDGEKSNAAPSEGSDIQLHSEKDQVSNEVASLFEAYSTTEKSNTPSSKGSLEEVASKTKPPEAVSVNPNLECEIKGDEVTITGTSKRPSNYLIIPKIIEGKPVTSIGDKAFNGRRLLKSITIPNGVTSIGDWAFSYTYVTSITIPDGVTSIGEYVFAFCPFLTSMTIPDSVTSIGEYAFGGCESLKSITIPNSVTSIGEKAFFACRSLTSMTIPDSVTSIGEYAFGGCESLTSMTIGNSVTSIGNEAFFACRSLTAVTFLGDAPKIGDSAFEKSSPTIYREADAKGWGDTFAGRPVKLITEKP